MMTYLMMQLDRDGLKTNTFMEALTFELIISS